MEVSDFMNDEFEFVSKEDEEACLVCWREKNQLTVDEYGRVFNEGGIWIANIKLQTESEEVE